MAFPKAIQNVNPEAHEKYIAILMEYKTSCSMDTRLRKLYKKSQLAEERLRYYDFHERHLEVCSAFYKARDEYARIRVTNTLKEKGVDISGLTLAQVTGIQVPMSMKAIIAQNAQEKAIAALENDPAAKRLYEQLKNSNKKTEETIQKEPNSTKAKFLASIEQDCTLDDTPLSITDEELN